MKTITQSSTSEHTVKENNFCPEKKDSGNIGLCIALDQFDKMSSFSPNLTQTAAFQRWLQKTLPIENEA